MKKTLIKASLFTILFVLCGLSFMADSNVTVYGRLHLSVEYLDNSDDGALNVSSNSSRLGFRGQLPVSDSLSAIFQLEGTVDTDIRGGQIATRDSFVGLRGDFGTLRLGYFDTPLKTIRSRTDLFGDQIGDARNMTLGNDHRFRNSIGYTSPKLGKVTIDSQFSVDQNNQATATDNDDWAFSSSVFVRESNIYAGIAYEIRNSGDDDVSAIRAGLSYTINAIRLTAFVQHFSAEADAITIGGGMSYKVNDDFTVKGQAYLVNSDNDDSNGIMLALGTDHRLSRHTLLYTAFAMSSNDDNAMFASSGGGHGSTLMPAPGEDTMSISLGLRVDF